MGCTLALGENWKHSKVYQTWENVSNPLILILAVISLIGSCAVIICALCKSARMQQNNAAKQERVVRGIRKTCIISMIQATLILASTLPLRIWQIRKRVDTCNGELAGSGCIPATFSTEYVLTARL